VKCPNALKTQSRCGETFLGGKKKNLEKLENVSEKRGNCNNKIFPMILPFDMTRMEKKNLTKAFIFDIFNDLDKGIGNILEILLFL
jgi:hypothetical protein